MPNFFQLISYKRNCYTSVMDCSENDFLGLKYYMDCSPKNYV